MEVNYRIWSRTGEGDEYGTVEIVTRTGTRIGMMRATVGDIAREAIAADAELAKQARAMMKKGGA